MRYPSPLEAESELALAVWGVALMGQGPSPGVEGVAERVVEQVGDVRHVDVRVAEEAPREVRRVVVSAEDAPKVGVEQ